MRFSRVAAVAAVAVVSLATAANAVVVPGVNNTGAGLASGDGQTDANYTVVSSSTGTYAVGTNAKTYYNPAYIQDGPLSRFVNATGDGNGVDGETTTFRTTFDLTGYDALNATLSGQFAADDAASVFLNGNLIATYSGFNSLSPFGTNANFFNAGINFLDFAVTNGFGPTAFQVAGLTVTADALPGGGAVPEPATWAMLVLGFGLVGSAIRRRRSAHAFA